jgi:hypothetical protein
MIVLTLKNKSLEALDRLLNQANKREFAIVNEFELTPSDLFCIITELDSPEMKAAEMTEKRKEYRSRFKVESKDNSANIFDFFSLKRDFVDKWFKREYTVTYQGVPLHLLRENRSRLTE